MKLEFDMDNLHILVYTKEFRVRGQIFSVAALQNIQTKLEEHEIESSQKLIRVLTHEIMNSVTLISSLAGTVKNILNKCKLIYNAELNQDLNDAVNTIQKRSECLMKFVDKYRSLTRIQVPQIEELQVQSLFSDVELLKKNIGTTFPIRL